MVKGNAPCSFFGHHHRAAYEIIPPNPCVISVFTVEASFSTNVQSAPNTVIQSREKQKGL